jgi:Protein of unknown function (DUF2911)
VLVRIRLLLTLLLVSLSLLAQGQKPQRPSPSGEATFSFASDGKKITVAYSRPYMKGRKIMGEVVPYDKLWRTGANEATVFTTEANLDIGGTKLPAGKYSLFTMPGKDTWEIIFNQETGQWGTVHDPSKDVARIKVKPVHLDQPVEQFTISVEHSAEKSGVMKLEWENTSVPVEFNESAK